MADPFIVFEVNRYLGWPAQAPSYKVGERIWLQAREEVKQRKGAEAASATSGERVTVAPRANQVSAGPARF